MLVLESQFADVAPEGLQDHVPHDVKVFGVINAPLGQLVMAESRAGWARTGVSLHGIDAGSTWLGRRSNNIHRLGHGGGVDGEVAGKPLNVRRDRAGLPWRSRNVRLRFDGREYVLVRSGRTVALLDDRDDVVATSDERQRQLATDRSGSECLLAILCFAANLDGATRSPIVSLIQ